MKDTQASRLTPGDKFSMRIVIRVNDSVRPREWFNRLFRQAENIILLHNLDGQTFYTDQSGCLDDIVMLPTVIVMTLLQKKILEAGHVVILGNIFQFFTFDHVSIRECTHLAIIVGLGIGSVKRYLIAGGCDLRPVYV